MKIQIIEKKKKVIKIINKKNDIKECSCNFCNTKFYYTDDDIIDVNENYLGFICPECGNEIEIIKINNCKFPKSFFHFGEGKILTYDEIQEYVDRVKMLLETSNEDSDYNLISCGDTIVFGTKDLDEGITIYVAKNYYECYLN